MVDSEMTIDSMMRSPIRSATGRLWVADSPKSPRRMMLVIHFQYWTWNGSLNPQRLLSASMADSSSVTPNRSM